MPNTNIVIIEGHAGKNAELKYLSSGKPYAVASVATSTGTGDKERTEWHRIVAWGSQAEELGKALTGWIVSVKGRIQTREYEQNGVKKYMVEIIADSLRVQEHKKKEASAEDAAPVAKPAAKGKIQDMEDDIPF